MNQIQEQFQQLVEQEKQRYFEKTEAEIIGVMIARHFRWCGHSCFEAMQAALQDSNYQTVSKALSKTWDRYEKPLYKGASHV